jgi:hypothetical protein
LSTESIPNSRTKEARRERSRERRKLNRVADDLYNEKLIARRHEHKRLAMKVLGGKCWVCGGEYHASVYDFHHLDPKLKEVTPAKLLASRDFAVVLTEIRKCALLCANCHRLVHAGMATVRRHK